MEIKIHKFLVSVLDDNRHDLSALTPREEPSVYVTIQTTFSTHVYPTSI